MAFSKKRESRRLNVARVRTDPTPVPAGSRQIRARLLIETHSDRRRRAPAPRHRCQRARRRLHRALSHLSNCDVRSLPLAQSAGGSVRSPGDKAVGGKKRHNERRLVVLPGGPSSASQRQSEALITTSRKEARNAPRRCQKFPDSFFLSCRCAPRRRGLPPRAWAWRFRNMKGTA
ncbi:hypothetical protein AAFF_G00276310 [Aldrovandia affinis]|uniref:Uncharacterized protein n=1 Tax=Aldrovandia affinis TaxID=143900 RepID=A0AAD7W249_9TELE|nr:hypothetical protein AAFF_G00276310 [Aldrovandia affinis]